MGEIDDDPTYNQPKPALKSNQSQSSTTADDPTYNQPKPTSAGEDSIYDQQTPLDRDRDGRGEVTEDPTYNQPKPEDASSSFGSKGITDDPTYNQPRSISSISNDVDNQQTPLSREEGGKGEVTEDPTYNQPKPEGTSSSSDSNVVADDPTYNQPKPNSPDDNEADTQQTPLNREEGGKGEVTEDPAYNQPQLDRQDSQPVADDPTYNQPKQESRASERLRQLNNQIAPTPSEADVDSHTSKANTRKPRRKKQLDYQSQLPADHSDVMGHIATMQDFARNPPADHRGYTRQKASGKLTARDRVAALLNAGTFREIGSVTGTTKWSVDPENPLLEKVEDFIPSNNPQGFGQVTCLKTGSEKVKRQVYLTADDFSIRGGHADGHNKEKTVYGEVLALRLKVPVIKLVDGSSGGGSVTTIAKTGFSYLPHVTILKTVVKQLNAGIPNLGAVVGPAIGLGAARVVSTHFSVMAADIGSLFNAGPKVVEGATFEEGLSFQDLGGPLIHCCNGTIDNMAKDEAECYEQIRTVLGYLPDCGALQAPPCLPDAWSGDDVEREDLSLRSIVPRKKNRMYDPYRIVESVVDRGSWFEIGRFWGRTGIVGLARLGGRPVAILSNNCEVNGGALDALGSQKLLKMIKFADIFNLPIVQFVDVRKYKASRLDMLNDLLTFTLSWLCYWYRC